MCVNSVRRGRRQFINAFKDFEGRPQSLDQRPVRHVSNKARMRCSNFVVKVRLEGKQAWKRVGARSTRAQAVRNFEDLNEFLSPHSGVFRVLSPITNRTDTVGWNFNWERPGSASEDSLFSSSRINISCSEAHASYIRESKGAEARGAPAFNGNLECGYIYKQKLVWLESGPFCTRASEIYTINPDPNLIEARQGPLQGGGKARMCWWAPARNKQYGLVNFGPLTPGSSEYLPTRNLSQLWTNYEVSGDRINSWRRDASVSCRCVVTSSTSDSSHAVFYMHQLGDERITDL
ncbi:hypothetical protein DFH06DRAFT_1137084 [Mycena polygramma]|nr:hypothetical protein DFH06DRAFT_1137084 [Mycena polygramma]